MIITPNKNFTVNYEKLDESQKNAIRGIEDNIVIKAPAGSGKTSTLITAIADYRYEHINDRICAITYTRAARAEMEERLKELGIYDVEVTTIHVWARNFLYEFGRKYDLKINILEEADIKAILQTISREYLVRSKVKSINIGILYQYITGTKKMDITENYRRTLNALEDRYIKHKRDNHLYDFTDYPLYLYDVMTEYNETINNIDALFVDEFQDVDSIQLKIFNRTNCFKKFFIGDSWQAIFAFRGADGEAFNKLDNFTVYKLKYNYRSYQEIIDYAVHVYETLRYRCGDRYITQIAAPEPCDIKCNRGYGGEVSIVDPWGECYSYSGFDGVGRRENWEYKLQSMLEKNPMILCRTNKQVKTIVDNSYYTAETIHQAKGLEYDNVIVIDTAIKEEEDLNIAYVALTRAKNSMLVISWPQFEYYLLNN